MELLKDELDNNNIITELDIINNIDNIQEYESDEINFDEIDLSSESEMTDIEI